jgi:hypothetical protein
MTTTLFNIGNDLLALNALLEESGGEVTPDAEEAIDLWFAELQVNEGQKLDNYLHLLRTLDMEHTAAAAASEQYEQLAHQRTSRINWLRQRLLEHLLRTGRNSALSASGIKIAIHGNGGKAPIVWDRIPEMSELAPALKRESIDNEAIRRCLEEGVPLPFCHLGERGVHLSAPIKARGK